MRNVGVRGVPKTALLGHLIGLAALALMLALVAPAADAAEQMAALPEAGPVAAPSAAPEADYYTRRAKTILDAEKAGDQKPHPLAAPYPGMNVIVCEAGCPASGRPEIVFLRPRFISAPGPAESAASDVPGSTKSPTCVGGCYADAGHAIAMESALVADPVPSEIGEWMTTIKTPIVRDKLSPIR
jgi:hypothetical protein